MTTLARRLLALLLPSDVRAAVIEDLDAEYERTIRPARGRLRAAAWYWRQVAGSLGPALTMRLRRRERWGTALVHDARFSLRMLGRYPGFSAAVIATLALGIGATSALVSLVDVILVRPLPYAEPDRLVRVWSANPRGIPRAAIGPADYFDWRDRASTVDAIAAYTSGNVTVTGHGEAIGTVAATVTANLVDTLGVRPILGRWFSTADDPATVVVISEGLWREWFAGDTAILGRTITCDGRARTVIGVMPRTFQFPSVDERLWLPLPDGLRAEPRNAHYLGVVARLKQGVSLDAARDNLRSISRELEQAYPDTNRGWGVTVAPMREWLVGDVRPALLGLLGAVGCVLLIACANVAGLLLARGAGRSREFAVRAAVGASRARLVRQLLVESTVLAGLGGVLGVGLASWALAAARAARGLDLPFLDRVELDPRSLVATAGLTLLSVVLAGVAPAWRSARSSATGALTSGTRTTTTGIGARRAIVFGQIVLATVLIAAGALLLKSFVRLASVPSGFAADRTLLAEVALPASRYTREGRAPFFDRVLERLRQMPGIEAAAAGGPLPLSGEEGLLRFGVRIEGRQVPANQPDRIYLRWATPDYFRAMGIQQRTGRAFAASDTPAAQMVAVVDEAFARQFFDAGDPLGKRLQLSNERGLSRVIVGVVGSVRQTSLDRSADPHVYVPEAQYPSAFMTFVVRSADAATSAAMVREAVRAVDPELPLTNVRTLAELVNGSTAPQRTNTIVLSVFAAAALVLTLVGVYGVVAQSIAQSTREIGIRLALGATTSEVARLTVRRTSALAAAGVGAGSAVAWFFAPALQGLLYGVSPRDPLVLIGAAGLLMIAAATAASVPARRILRLDVVNTLRAD